MTEQEKEVKEFLKYVRDLESEFAFLPILRKWGSNLPANILIDDDWGWINLCNKKIILFQTNNSYDCDYNKMLPMSIEKNSKILVKDEEIDLTLSEIDEIKRFVIECKKQLLQISKGKIDMRDFFDVLKEKGFYKRKRKRGF